MKTSHHFEKKNILQVFPIIGRCEVKKGRRLRKKYRDEGEGGEGRLQEGLNEVEKITRRNPPLVEFVDLGNQLKKVIPNPTFERLPAPFLQLNLRC